MSDPFIYPVPKKIADDPDLAAYFNFQRKAMQDLFNDVQLLREQVNELLEA